MDIEEGTYYIVNAKSIRNSASAWKYLSVTGATTDQNGAVVEIHNVNPPRQQAQWKVSKVNGAMGGYTLQLKMGGKYLDADAGNILSNGCKVQLWNRGSDLLPRTNQEWYIERKITGSFEIKNILGSNPSGDRVLHVSSSSANMEGANVTLNVDGNHQYQHWFFIKVPN